MCRHVRYDHIIRNGSIYPLRLSHTSWYDYQSWDTIALSRHDMSGRYYTISRIHGYQQSLSLISMMHEMKYRNITLDAWSYYYMIQLACRDQQMIVVESKWIRM